MANPLARVVMNNIAQKSGKVASRPNNAVSLGTTNLGKDEERLLSSLLNSKGNVTKSGVGSYDKNSYGRTTKVSNRAGAMQTLDSLASKKGVVKESSSNNSYQGNTNYNNNTNNTTLSTLNTLSNISVGKSSVERDSRNIMQKVSLGDLASGGSKSEKKEVKTSYNQQQSSITSLGDLAGKVKKLVAMIKKKKNLTIVM
ncbi:hypothetical protein Curi_c29080 [Gottschalkia acidurici 9a]|uniref:Uncharacterized protein n=1 Tax=Gottschalkia acidurici (strain ATCC 7906 / DSM 604 / BCRC 14475 / CIP 104303 / KCTC 5404 / NCIMB 10678 / 9a) TaxID=1128398 RepID=K0B350_GOTA9|nr:hypothetical protein [Gottschalkia acidurici]AFS79874.1 hypothetical protein Curi_c29080 [Gottschalkia acidurici 9a]